MEQQENKETVLKRLESLRDGYIQERDGLLESCGKFITEKGKENWLACMNGAIARTETQIAKWESK